MQVKVKIDESQEFKTAIVQRIQEELHKILKEDFEDIVKNHTIRELDKHNYVISNLQSKIDDWGKDIIKERIRKIFSDSPWSYSKLDAYIQDFIDKHLLKKFEETLEKRLGISK